jgi:hypothetical protein
MSGAYLPKLAKHYFRVTTSNVIEMYKRNEAFVMCERTLNAENNRALLAAFRNFVNQTGADHSEIAHELGISPGAILGWMHGTIELRSRALVAIKRFIEKDGAAYLRAAQRDNQAEREQTKWHPFLQ